MYRVMDRMVVVAGGGHFRDVLALVEEINGLLRNKGLAEFRTLVPSFGRLNEFILETEYPDLATYERETEAFNADEEIMKAWSSGSSHILQGSFTSELLETAPS